MPSNNSQRLSIALSFRDCDRQRDGLRIVKLKPVVHSHFDYEKRIEGVIRKVGEAACQRPKRQVSVTRTRSVSERTDIFSMMLARWFLTVL